jgi:hypothetical protein
MVRKAWVAYAALFTAAIVGGEVTNLVQGGGLDLRTVGNWVVTLVLLIATWGYALQRPFGSTAYWRPAFWVVLVASLATAVPAALAGSAALLIVAALLPLVAPAFYAAYRYAYRSPQLWRTEEPAP